MELGSARLWIFDAVRNAGFRIESVFGGHGGRFPDAEGALGLESQVILGAVHLSPA